MEKYHEVFLVECELLIMIFNLENTQKKHF